jgi:hypothetical protein
MAPDEERTRRRRDALAPLLGGECRLAAVEEMLVRRAHEWAAAVAGDGGELREAASLDDALDGSGPTLLVWPELPLWLPATGAAALDDLEAGCAASLGPVFDGRLYLLAVAEPDPALVVALRRAPAMGPALRVVEERKLEVGLLRAERGLRDAGDVRALLADPLTDPELRGLLE